MKKRVKMIVALALVVIMGFVSQESFLANERWWQIMKMPGSTNVSTNVYIPFYEEDITYELKSLTGTCSYVVAKCVTHPGFRDIYYIDNEISGFRFTKPDKVTFKLTYTGWEILNRPQTTFIMSIEHNSINLINETLTSTGTISY